jgi:hypothetical protein
MRRVIVATALCLLGVAGPAGAAQLITSPLWTGVNNSAACYVRNTGTTAVSVTVSLFSNNGTTAPFDDCNDGPLAAGRTCVIILDDIPDDSFIACSATAGSVAKLRGAIEIRNSAVTVVNSEEMR